MTNELPDYCMSNQPQPAQYLLVVNELGMARLRAAFGTSLDIDFLPVNGLPVGGSPDLHVIVTPAPKSAVIAAEPVPFVTEPPENLVVLDGPIHE